MSSSDEHLRLPPRSGHGALHHRTATAPTQPREAAISLHVDAEADDGPAAAERSSTTTREKRLERFMEYSKRALLYEFPLATSLLQHWTASFIGGSAWAKAGVALLCAALFVDLMGSVYLALVTRPLDAEVTDASCRWHGFRVYASGVLLMSMPFCLLMSLNALYAFLAVALVPPIYLVFLLFAKEHRHGHRGGVLHEFPPPRGERTAAISYEDYDGKLKSQFDASAAVNTIATGAGLMGTFFGYSTANFSPNHDVTVSESLLFLTVVGAQFVMLVTAARPMFCKESSPARLAGFLGLLVGSLPVLLSLSAFAGAIDYLGGLALLPFSIDFLELVFFFKATFYKELEEERDEMRRRQARPTSTTEGLQLLWLCVMYIYFTALEALYQELARTKTTDDELGGQVGWVDSGRVLVYFWAFCCCSLDGGKGKLPLLPPLEELRKRHHQSLGRARCAVMVLAALDVLWRVAWMLVKR
uniref:OSIGBa0126J24.8 protein n=1 Tax=Oryza sativa TaxID=4530 RepID=Q01N02_ORYSA|nr:OSIGBa0126J24.8 [Oryza sativa]